MRDYFSGQIYSFEVLQIQELNEKKYIFLSDGYKDTFRVLPYDYQLEWERCNLSKILNCYVVSVNEFGLPLLAQVRKEVLAHNYTEEGTEYEFKLVAIRQDTNTLAQYYELHDVFGLTHRYYPKPDEPEREIASIFSLFFNGIDERVYNKAYLKLAPKPNKQVHYVLPNIDSNDDFTLGEEGEKVEFKSTIIYPAGSIEADIDQQMIIICKTIAGFMNKSGGVLYIGVNDSGRVSGISQDFDYLNSSKENSYTYQLNNDGYENKIRNSVKNLLGNTANANIQISFLTNENINYCKIDIQEVLKPIFLNQSKVFQRAGNMTQLLKGDEIVWFIEERFRKRIGQEGTVVPPSKPENIDEISEETENTQNINSSESLISIPKPYTINDNIWYWMSFYQNGAWSFDTQPSQAVDKIYEVAIPKTLKKERLIMAYKNGCVNVVIPYDQIKPSTKKGRRLKNRGQIYSNGWNTSSEILSMFCVDGKDLLVFQSQKTDGSEWVKIHNADGISVHGALHLAGNVLINPNLNAKLLSIDPLSLNNFHFISSLVLKNHQTSGYLGFRRNDKSLDKVYMTLDKLLSM
jgi:hypothetical protein